MIKRRLSTESTPIYVIFVVVRLYQPVCPNVPAIVRLYQLSDQRQSSEGLSRFLSYFSDKIVLKHFLNNISIYMTFETLHCTTCRVPRKNWTRECPNVPTLTLASRKFSIEYKWFLFGFCTHSRVFPDAGYCVFYSQKWAWDPQKIIMCAFWDSQ